MRIVSFVNVPFQDGFYFGNQFSIHINSTEIIDQYADAMAVFCRQYVV